MSARADDAARYVRQRMLAEVGATGQERLAAARVRLRGGTSSARAHGADYLGRAGLEVVGDERHADADVHTLELLAAPSHPAALAPAADLLVGALAAVECIKGVLGVGQPLTLNEDLFQLGDE